MQFFLPNAAASTWPHFSHVDNKESKFLWNAPTHYCMLLTFTEREKALYHMKQISFVTYSITKDTFNMTSILNLTFSQWHCWRFQYSGMRCCVLMQAVPNCSALIFRFKESIKIMFEPEHIGTMNLQNIRNYSHSDKCHMPEDLNCKWVSISMSNWSPMLLNINW